MKGVKDQKENWTDLQIANSLSTGNFPDISAGKIKIKKFLDELAKTLEVPYHMHQIDPTPDQPGENTAVYCVRNNLSLIDRLYFERKISNPALPIIVVTKIQYNPESNNQKLDAIVANGTYHLANQLTPAKSNIVPVYLAFLEGNVRTGGKLYPEKSITHLQ